MYKIVYPDANMSFEFKGVRLGKQLEMDKKQKNRSGWFYIPFDAKMMGL